MSGGVDSSVAAYLLKEEGYEVIGVTMQIWQEEEWHIKEENGGCCGLSAIEDARRVAQLIDIPYYVMNFRSEFKEKVISYFIDEYVRGRTPNPCNACNRYIKWESLLKRSSDIGADYIATGHYARVKRLENGRYTLQTSAALNKDQTYALCHLSQEQLAHTLMPIGEYTKDEVRAIGVKAGLPVARKRDSQEICFIPDQDYARFIDEHAKKEVPPPGNFVGVDGKILGRHKGITHYTIGQRKGLNLSLGKPVFVTAIKAKSNEVVVGEAKDVWTDRLIAGDLNYMAATHVEDGKRLLAKIRYSHQGAYCRVSPFGNGKLKCTFEEPVRAVTPGQAVAFYDGDCLFLGGTIE